VRKREGRRSFGKVRRRCEYNIKMDLKKVGWDDVEWIYLAQDRTKWRADVNTVMDLQMPSKAISIFTS
jgi:hypothetical protein